MEYREASVEKRLVVPNLPCWIQGQKNNACILIFPVSRLVSLFRISVVHWFVVVS